jgi:hypothetical protein
MNASDQKEVCRLSASISRGDGRRRPADLERGQGLRPRGRPARPRGAPHGAGQQGVWRPDINRVKALACNRWRDRYRDRQDALRIVDLIRRDNPAAYPPDVGDIPAVLGYFGRAWADVEADAADGPGRVAARVYILAHCRRALTELGISPAEADAEARTIVGLEPGERVMRVRLFQEMPPPGQTAWDATKALARAEFGHGTTAEASHV